jgi:hypothetical protein
MKKILILFFIFAILQIIAPVLIFTQDYDGLLQPPRQYSTGESDAAGVAIGDVNNDGLNDVVVMNGYYSDPENDFKLFVFLQSASGELSNPVKYNGIQNLYFPKLHIADVNSDSLNDVVVNTLDGFGVYYQNGSGTLNDIITFTTTYSSSSGINVGDFNNDSRIDVVLSSSDILLGNKIEVFLQDINGQFNTPTIYDNTIFSSFIAIGDTDNNMLVDIISFHTSKFSIFHQNGDGILDAAVEYDIGEVSDWIAVGDVNGDGRDDIVVTLYRNPPDARIFIFYQNVGGTLNSMIDFVADDRPDAVTIGDVNRDSRMDIIIEHGGSEVGVFFQKSDGTLEAEFPYDTIEVQHSKGIDFGDINNDGYEDVVMAKGIGQGLVINRGWDGSDLIVVREPSKGDSIDVDSTIWVYWGTIGDTVDVQIDLSTNGGGSWDVITYSTNDDGSYSFTTPYTESTNCLIRVSDVDGSPVGVSETFSIVDDGVERIRVLSPNGGETLTGESTHEITWETTGPIANVEIEYSTDNGTSWTSITGSTGNDGSYEWTVPNISSDQCLVRISDTDGNPSDTSNSTFSIVPIGTDTLNLTFPNGGESLPGGVSHTITWTSSGTISSIKIEYSTNNGTSWTTITDSTANDGSHSWEAPNIESTECLVRISDALDGDPVDQSAGVFSIVMAGTETLTLLAPNGGETFGIGILHYITWKSSGRIDNVQIEYSFDNGNNWTIVAASTANDGSYTWSVPDTPSFQCLVRISDASDSDPSDVSNAVFTIVTPQPSITITSPQGGEYWQVGSTHDITWTTFKAVGNVKIEYSTNNKSSWNTIVSSTTNDGSHSWTIPNTPSSSCFIKISEAADGFPYNINYSAFSIVTGSVEPEIGVNHTALYFGSLKSSSAKTPPQQIIVDNSSGVGTLRWQASDDASWLLLDNTTGIQSGVINASINPFGLAVGTHVGSITITDPNATNSPQTIDVTLTVYAVLSDKGPFGSFDTPVNGSTVMSSIPVTGWALDDIGVESVTLWRDAVEGEGSGQVYIGDAVMVEGARPDIEQTYPSYPVSYKAGWGYMMLTYFLPNGGNGTFKLYAYAEDDSGHEVLLGTKTITCDNAHAVKPFGAIDTPKQGGSANGSSFRNHGWVLTPMPNKIPENGTTIIVYIDGIPLGNPAYNIFRDDIAALFPGYANSSRPHAFLDFDTTTYSNGLHTIQWVAADNAGNADGIGSRYFSIQNSGYINQVAAIGKKNIKEKEKIRRYHLLSQLTELQANQSKTIGLKRGYKKNVKPERIPVGKNGRIQIELKEDNRIELHLAQSPGYWYSGYLVVGKELRPLPTGSSLDRKTGVFYWQPGPGYIGKYELLFIAADAFGKMNKGPVTITITPKFEIKKSL